MAANALVGSQFDYCNSLFRSVSALDLRKQQCVQNSLTRIVKNTHTSLPLERLSIGCLLNTVLCSRLPYLCISSYLVVIHNILYLSLNLDIVSITGKGQADGVLLEVPHFTTSVCKSTKHFGLSFGYDAPRIWNDLPDDACSATSLHSFIKKFKTYLFPKAYPH